MGAGWLIDYMHAIMLDIVNCFTCIGEGYYESKNKR